MDRDTLKRAIAEKAVEAGNASGKRSAYAELVVEVAQPSHLTTDLLGMFLNVTNMNPGDKRGRRVKRGRYPARTMVPGSKHLTDVTSYVQNEITAFDRLIAGTSASLWEIQSGEIGTVDSLKNEIRADLFDEIVSRAFTLLSTVWNGTDTPNNYFDNTSAGVTQTSLDTAIENVIDVSGNVRAIIGPRKALLPVYKFAQFREFVLGGSGNNPDRTMFPVMQAFDEFSRTGRVSTYMGIPIIEMPQVYRNRLPANSSALSLRDPSLRMIPTNKILVVGENAGEFALMGGTEFQDYTDLTTQPPNYVMHMWQSFGMIVDDPEYIAVIETNT